MIPLRDATTGAVGTTTTVGSPGTSYWVKLTRDGDVGDGGALAVQRQVMSAAMQPDLGLPGAIAWLWAVIWSTRTVAIVPAGLDQ